MFSKKSYWFSSGMFTLLERMSFMLFGFGGVFFQLKLGMFTEDEFGTWALFLTVTSIIEVARNGLIQNALVKHLASSPKEEHGAITSASLALNLLLTGLTVIFLLTFSGFLSRRFNMPQLDEMLHIYILVTLALVGISQLTFIQQANFDFKGNFWGNFARQGSVFGYIVFCYFSQQKLTLINIAWVQVGAALLGGGVSYFFGRKYVMVSGKIQWDWVSKLFHFGKFTMGSNLSVMLYKSIDKIMIGWLMKTPAFVGVYDLAVRITNLIEVPTAAMASIVLPQSAKRSVTEGPRAVKYLYEKSVGVIIAMILPMVILIWFLAEPGVLLIAGEKYKDTVPILQITLLYGLLVPYSRQFGTSLDSMGKPKINLLFIVISLVMNITFNYFLIPYFGLLGAAYGALLTTVIRMALNLVVLRRLLDVRFSATLLYAMDFYVQCFKFVTANVSKVFGTHRSAL